MIIIKKLGQHFDSYILFILKGTLNVCSRQKKHVGQKIYIYNTIT